MMIKKRTYITAAALLILSVAAVAHDQEPIFLGLEYNREYVELRERNDKLLVREDSIQNLITTARTKFSSMRDSLSMNSDILDEFSTYIIKLEESIFELRQERGNVITAINNIEQQYILENMYTATDYVASEYNDDTGSEIDRGVRDLTKNTIFSEMLSSVDYEELLTAQGEDMAIGKLVDEYLNTYNSLQRTATEYNTTTDEQEANALFTKFHTLQDEAKTISEAIGKEWNHILDTKYYAYGSILEQRLRYDVLESSSEEFSTMRQQCNSDDGYYASDALMHYAIGRSTLLDFEIAFAREMQLSESLDSLQAVRNNLITIGYDLTPLSIERRLFLDYEPIEFGATNYYNSSNPLPQLKVYERGTIYRLLLGTFRSKQSMNIFKGVRPIYIAQNDEGNYCYYTGGYATRGEADEAQLQLKERGFRQPEVCRWRDGEMVNISRTASEEQSDNETPSGYRYIVVIECSEMGDDLRATISTAAPDKRISRAGTNFIIGTFTDRTEAESLTTTLTTNYPDLSTTIKELDL